MKTTLMISIATVTLLAALAFAGASLRRTVPQRMARRNAIITSSSTWARWVDHRLTNP